MTAPIHQRIQESITYSSALQQRDALVILFESDVSPLILLELLSKGTFSIESPEKAALLRDIFVDRMASKYKSKTQKNFLTFPPQTVAFPRHLHEPWPRISLGKQDKKTEQNVEIAGAQILGRLIAGAGGIGKGPQDALDVALYRGWTPVTRQILTHFPPAAENLNARHLKKSKLNPKDETPWLHRLALEKRTGEIQDWLSIPGIHPNIMNPDGDNALFYARDAQTLQKLVEGGVKIGHLNRKGAGAAAGWLAELDEEIIPESVLDEMRDIISRFTPDKDQHRKIILSQTVDQWLDARHGPELKRIPKTLLQEIGAAKTRITTQKTNQEWGILAYMGLKLPCLIKSYHTHSNEMEVLNRWKAFIQKAPEQWFTHESVSNIPDGWILATCFINQSCFQKFQNPGLELFRLTLERMDSIGHPLNVKKEAMVIRVSETILQMADNKEEYEKWSATLCEMSEMHQSDNMAELWGGNPDGNGLAEILIEGVLHPETRKAILSAHQLLLTASPYLAKQLQDETIRQNFWENVFEIYESRVKADSRHGYNNQNLHNSFAIMVEELMKEQCLPRVMKSPQAQKGLRTLRQKVPDITTLESFILKTSMETFLPDKENIKPKRRL